MPDDDRKVASITELSRAECLHRLATKTVGRVGLVVDGRPEVLPVNYAIDGDTVLYRTAPGTNLERAGGQVVAFEVDDLESDAHEGWSVLIQGVAEEIGDAIDPTSERLKHLVLTTWAPGERDRWFHVITEHISGRRIHVEPDAL